MFTPVRLQDQLRVELVERRAARRALTSYKGQDAPRGHRIGGHPRQAAREFERLRGTTRKFDSSLVFPKGEPVQILANTANTGSS